MHLFSSFILFDVRWMCDQIIILLFGELAKMSKSLKSSLSAKHYKLLVKYIGIVLADSEQSTKVCNKELLTTFGINKADFLLVCKQWWTQKIKYLTINHSDVAGLSVRLYKSQFKLTKKLMALNKDNQGSTYFRYRDRETQKLLTKKLGHYSPDGFKEHVVTATKLIASNQLGNCVLSSLSNLSPLLTSMPLREFLMGEFYEEKLAENPKTADEKVKIVIRNFGHLLDKDLNEINADSIKKWLKGKERVLTKKQIRAGDSHWVVKPSTLKSAVCGIRTCIQFAKEKELIKEHDLYTLPKFKLDNDIIRYLSSDEEQRLFDAINKRNSLRLAERERMIKHRLARHLKPPTSLDRCAFSDHVTPFIILFKETGIRPGTIMNSLWTDIDFESRFFRIRKSIDKRAIANFVPLNDLAFSVLVEWKKHHIHDECTKHVEKQSLRWLFPSPQDASQQLSSIKTAWRGIIKSSGIDNFRFYDLRHDFASKVMMQTGNIYLVSDLLNHRQIETTKRYAHLMNESRVNAVRALDRSRNKAALPSFLIN